MPQKYEHRKSGIDCAECYRYIAQDDPIWRNEAGTYCTTCAVKMGLDCPQCHGTKKPSFKVCYDCSQKAKKANLI